MLSPVPTTHAHSHRQTPSFSNLDRRVSLCGYQRLGSVLTLTSKQQLQRGLILKLTLKRLLSALIGLAGLILAYLRLLSQRPPSTTPDSDRVHVMDQETSKGETAPSTMATTTAGLAEMLGQVLVWHTERVKALVEAEAKGAQGESETKTEGDAKGQTETGATPIEASASASITPATRPPPPEGKENPVGVSPAPGLQAAAGPVTTKTRQGLRELEITMGAAILYLQQAETLQHLWEQEKKEQQDRESTRIVSEELTVESALRDLYHPERPDNLMGFLKLVAISRENREAANIAALCYLEGIGIRAAPNAAYELLRHHYQHDLDAGPETTNPLAMRTKALLSMSLFYSEDYERATSLLREADEAGDAYAGLVFGRCLLGRHGFLRNVAGSFDRFSEVKPALREDQIVLNLARGELCSLHLKIEEYEDLQLTLEQIYSSPVAKAWYDAAKVILKASPDDASLGPQAVERAKAMVMQAAEAKYVNACMDVARNYADSKECMLDLGLTPNKTLAFKFYAYAAFQSNLQAQMYIGNALLDGIGVRQQPSLASAWNSQVVAQDPKLADFQAALAHYKGTCAGASAHTAFELFSRCAEAKHTQAYVYLGHCYMKGRGVEKDAKAAFEWYTKSAWEGDGRGQWELGNCYFDGRGTEADPSKAFMLYSKSAEQGNTKAHYSLGQCYYLGKGVEQDYKQAFVCYSKGASRGDRAAQFMVGTCYYEGHGVEQDYKMAIEYFSQSAAQSYATAQHRLGQCYLNGQGVEQDYKQAVEWFSKASEQKVSDGYAGLGTCYYYGLGVKQDYKQAYESFLMSVREGNTDAMYGIARCYIDGNGTEKDVQKAIEMLRKAAARGHSDAQYLLGECYYRGLCVERNAREAAELFAKSAEKRNASAQYYLGECYLNGHGVDLDHRQALEWFTRSAEQGNSEGQRALAECYHQGIGVTQDLQQAFEWYYKSAVRGNKIAQYMVGEWYYFTRRPIADQDVQEAYIWYSMSAAQGYAPAIAKQASLHGTIERPA